MLSEIVIQVSLLLNYFYSLTYLNQTHSKNLVRVKKIVLHDHQIKICMILARN